MKGIVFDGQNWIANRRIDVRSFELTQTMQHSGILASQEFLVFFLNSEELKRQYPS